MEVIFHDQIIRGYIKIQQVTGEGNTDLQMNMPTIVWDLNYN